MLTLLLSQHELWTVHGVSELMIFWVDCIAWEPEFMLPTPKMPGMSYDDAGGIDTECRYCDIKYYFDVSFWDFWLRKKVLDYYLWLLSLNCQSFLGMGSTTISVLMVLGYLCSLQNY